MNMCLLCSGDDGRRVKKIRAKGTRGGTEIPRVVHHGSLRAVMHVLLAVF